MTTTNDQPACTDECRHILAAHDSERLRALAERDEARATLARVEALHCPVEVEPSETICAACSTLRGSGENLRYFPYVDWPCATIDALAPTASEEPTNG